MPVGAQALVRIKVTISNKIKVLQSSMDIEDRVMDSIKRIRCRQVQVTKICINRNKCAEQGHL